MNVKEFASLKVGDKIRNDASNSDGTVTERDEDGVYIAWGANAARPFYFTAQSTAWFHWSKVE
jgi:hypothetical protein